MSEAANTDDFDIIEADTLPAPGEEPKAKVEADDPDPDADDDASGEDDGDDGEDRRLSHDADDEADDADGQKGKRKHKRETTAERNARRRRAEEQSNLLIQSLLRQNEEFAKRLSSVEGSTVATGRAQVDARLQEVERDISTADRIIAKAIEAGNGEDALAAMRLRDDAMAAKTDLVRAKETFERVEKDEPVRKTAPDAKTLLVQQWVSANSTWYGKDPASTAEANAIDAQVMADGYDPNSPAYYRELTRRINLRFHGEGGEAPRKKVDPTRKKAPPQGSTRDGAATGSRRTVVVTPERKQAMIAAGVWDDAVARREYLEEYAKYDREQSANR